MNAPVLAGVLQTAMRFLVIMSAVYLSIQLFVVKKWEAYVYCIAEVSPHIH